MVFQITVRSQKVPASVLKATKNSAFYKKKTKTPKTPTQHQLPSQQFSDSFYKKKPLHNKSSPHKKY
jgi:hypothetical protein